MISKEDRTGNEKKEKQKKRKGEKGKGERAFSQIDSDQGKSRLHRSHIIYFYTCNIGLSIINYMLLSIVFAQLYYVYGFTNRLFNQPKGQF